MLLIQRKFNQLLATVIEVDRFQQCFESDNSFSVRVRSNHPSKRTIQRINYYYVNKISRVEIIWSHWQIIGLTMIQVQTVSTMIHVRMVECQNIISYKNFLENCPGDQQHVTTRLTLGSTKLVSKVWETNCQFWHFWRPQNSQIWGPFVPFYIPLGSLR